MRRTGIVAAAVALLTAFSPALAQAATGWTEVGSDHARALDESQGLATIVRPSGTTIRYTGIGTIPADLNSQGWNHVGDPGSAQGWYVEPYQRDDRGAKLFRVQAPDGSWSNYKHNLESWEANNNSFAAVSPDARWLVAGEWGTMDRLLVHPMPGVAATDPAQNLPLSRHDPPRPPGPRRPGLRLPDGDPPALRVRRPGRQPLRHDEAAAAGRPRRRAVNGSDVTGPRDVAGPAPAAQRLQRDVRGRGHRLRRARRHPARDRDVPEHLHPLRQHDLPLPPVAGPGIARAWRGITRDQRGITRDWRGIALMPSQSRVMPPQARVMPLFRRSEPGSGTPTPGPSPGCDALRGGRGGAPCGSRPSCRASGPAPASAAWS